MKYLKYITEAKRKKYSEELESLKDALVELTDEKKVLFEVDVEDKSITVNIKLDHFFKYNFTQFYSTAGGIGSNDIQKINNFSNEVVRLVELLNEGLERSQIRYKRSHFTVDENRYINWNALEWVLSRNDDHNSEDFEDCDTLRYFIEMH